MARPDEVLELVSPGADAGGRIRLLDYPDDAVPAAWSRDLPASCATYADAVALPLTVEPGEHRINGALYTAGGALIADSQRGKANRAWAPNPPHVDLPTDVDTLAGRTLFVGYHRGVFGHVLLEVLTRLWPDLDVGAYDRVLFYPTRAGRTRARLRLPTYARDLLGALGLDPSTAHVVADRPLRVEQVTVTSPAFRLKEGYGPTVTRPFDRIGESFARRTAVRRDDLPARIYLSRSRLADGVRRADNETAVEGLFQRVGFRVVHPQELSIAEQVLMMRGASVVAGCDGSALHLAAFAAPGTRVVAVDSRPVRNQFLVEDFRGLDAVHVLAAAKAIEHRADRWHAELAAVEAALALADLTSG